MKFDDLVDAIAQEVGMPRDLAVRATVVALVLSTQDLYLATLEEDIDPKLARHLIDHAKLSVMESHM